MFYNLYIVLIFFLIFPSHWVFFGGVGGYLRIIPCMFYMIDRRLNNSLLTGFMRTHVFFSFLSPMLLIFTKSLWLHVKHFIALTKKESVRRIVFFVITDQLTQRKTRESTTALATKKKKADVRIKRVRSDSYLSYGQSTGARCVRKRKKKLYNTTRGRTHLLPFF